MFRDGGVRFFVNVVLLWPTEAVQVMVEPQISHGKACHGNVSLPIATGFSSSEAIANGVGLHVGPCVDALRSIRRVARSLVPYAEETNEHGAHPGSDASVDAVVSFTPESQKSEDLVIARREASSNLRLQQPISENVQFGEQPPLSAAQLDAKAWQNNGGEKANNNNCYLIFLFVGRLMRWRLQRTITL